MVYRELLALLPDNPKAHFRLAGVLAPAALNEEAAPVADEILGFVGSSFAALTEKQIGLFQ